MTTRKPEALSPWRVLLALVLLLACVLFIWSNSMQSAEASAELSRKVAAILYEMLSPIFGPDSWIVYVSQVYIRKIAHALEFAMLGITMVAMLGVLGWVNGHTVLHSAFAVLLVAVVDETIQAYTGRGSSVLDVVLDFAGGVGGIVLALLVGGLLRVLFGRGRRRKYE